MRRRRRDGHDDGDAAMAQNRVTLNVCPEPALPRAALPKCCHRNVATEMLPPKRCHRNVATEMLPPKCCHPNIAAEMLPPVSKGCSLQSLFPRLQFHASLHQPQPPGPAPWVLAGG